MMKQSMFLLVGLMAISGVVIAEDCLMPDETPSEAKITLTRLAEIGQCFEGKDELELAEKWLLRGAQEGSMYSQNSLGFLYHKGRGIIEQDFALALKWYEKASEQGSGYASHGIASMYSLGEGVSEDREKSLFYLKRSANQGYALGQYNLGLHYEFNDNKQAYKWFEKASQSGMTEAKIKVGDAYSYARGVEQSDTKAFAWYLAAAQDGDSDSQRSVAFRLLRGVGVSANVPEAIQWFIKSAEQGDEYAMTTLADIYLDGEFIGRNEDKATYWLKKAGLSLPMIKLKLAL